MNTLTIVEWIETLIDRLTREYQIELRTSKDGRDTVIRVERRR
jgi:hypothetical protein